MMRRDSMISMSGRRGLPRTDREFDEWLRTQHGSALRRVERLDDEYWEANAEAIMARVRATHRRDQSSDILEPPEFRDVEAQLDAGSSAAAHHRAPRFETGYASRPRIEDAVDLDAFVTPLPDTPSGSLRASIEQAPLPQPSGWRVQRHWWALGGALAMAAALLVWLRVAPSPEMATQEVDARQVRLGTTELEPVLDERAERERFAELTTSDVLHEDPETLEAGGTAVLPGELPPAQIERSVVPTRRRVVRSAPRTPAKTPESSAEPVMEQEPVLWRDNLKPAAFVEGIPSRPAVGDLHAALTPVALEAGRCLKEGTRAIAQVVFGSEGRVQSIRVQGVPEPEARRCVARAMQPASVDPFAESKHEVSVPIRGRR